MRLRAADRGPAAAALLLAITGVVAAGLAAVALETAAGHLRSGTAADYSGAEAIGAAGAVVAAVSIVCGAWSWTTSRNQSASTRPSAIAVLIGAIAFLLSGGVALVAVLLTLVFKGAEF